MGTGAEPLLLPKGLCQPSTLVEAREEGGISPRENPQAASLPQPLAQGVSPRATKLGSGPEKSLSQDPPCFFLFLSYSPPKVISSSFPFSWESIWDSPLSYPSKGLGCV